MKSSKAIFAALFLVALAFGYGQHKKDTLREVQTFELSNGSTFRCQKPRFFDMFKYLPRDIADFGKFIVQNENLIWTGSAIGATAAIVPFDQQLLDESIKFGSNFNFDGGHSYSNIGHFRVIPNDIHSAIYYVGNGGTTLLLSGAFYAIGHWKGLSGVEHVKRIGGGTTFHGYYYTDHQKNIGKAKSRPGYRQWKSRWTLDTFPQL